MQFRLRIECHIPEDPEEPEEILILQIGRRAVLIHLHRQHIPFFPDKRGQVELRRRKGILRIPYKLSVQPHIHSLFHTLKADAYPSAQKPCLQVKYLPIGSHRIICRLTERPRFRPVLSQRISRAAVHLPLPRVHGVDIMNLIISRHLDMTGHPNLPELFRVKVLPEKIRRAALRICRISKLPHPVQRLVQ